MEPGEPSSGATWDVSQTVSSHINQSSRVEQEVTFPDTPPQASREPTLSPVQYPASDPTICLELWPQSPNFPNDLATSCCSEML